MAWARAGPCRLGLLALLPLPACAAGASETRWRVVLQGLFLLGLQGARPSFALSAPTELWPAGADSAEGQAPAEAERGGVAVDWSVGVSEHGLGGGSPPAETVTLEIRTCECDDGGTAAPVELRLSANGSWRELPSPFRAGSYFTMRLPAGTKRVELRILGHDGWCISSMRIDWKPVISGLPAWLDQPCEKIYSCRRGSDNNGYMGCSSSHAWNVADLPDGIEPSFRSSGCSNYPLLLLGRVTVEGSVERCAARCLGTPLCTGFQFQPFTFCGWGDRPRGSCSLWNGECIRSVFGCFDQYVVKASFVRPMDLPLVGPYVTYPAGSTVPEKGAIASSGSPGWFSWQEELGVWSLLRLEGREIIDDSPTHPKRGHLQPDGLIRWQSGAISFPRSRIAMPASANDSASDLLRVRTCDVAGAGTTITIQYRLSEMEDWAYLGAFFERNQWYNYSVGPGALVQLRSLGSDSWCVGSIGLGGVSVRAGLPVWLQRPPTRHAAAIVAEGNIWSVEGRLPQDVVLVASRTGCSNWGYIYVHELSVEASVAACAERCREASRCTGFQFLPYVACEGSLLWGTCQLWAGDCIQEQGRCFNQYRLFRGERHGAGAGAGARRRERPGAIVAPVAASAALLLCTGISLVTSCGWARSRWTRDRSPSLCSASSSDDESTSASEDELGAPWWAKRNTTSFLDTPSEQTLKEKLQDPAWAAISLGQLEDLYAVAEGEFGVRISSVTMYDVNARILQPLCDQHRKCYAHVVNGEDPLFVQVFVSHAWRERFQEFVRSVKAPFVHWTRKPTIWICATALVQSADDSVVAMQVGLGDDPREAPFTRALARAEKMLVVRNSTCDLYDRIWCCWELHLALEIGLVHRPGSMMVTGPQGVTGKVVDIVSAQASSDEDKQKILAYVRSRKEGCEQVNRQLTEIRSFVF